MKTCYLCGGDVEQRVVEVEIGGVVVKNVPAEVCTQCGEKYFKTKVATFIQKVASYINGRRKEYFAEGF